MHIIAKININSNKNVYKTNRENELKNTLINPKEGRKGQREADSKRLALNPSGSAVVLNASGTLLKRLLDWMKWQTHFCSFTRPTHHAEDTEWARGQLVWLRTGQGSLRGEAPLETLLSRK